jgi:ribosomal protein L37AE/L43A
MSSSSREFKCRICKDKKINPSEKDISVCQDCKDEINGVDY